MRKRLLVLSLILLSLSIVCVTPSCVDIANKYQTRQVENKILRSSVSVIGLMGQGSGTVVSKEFGRMYILTCFHVIEESYMAPIIPPPIKVEYEKQDVNYRGVGRVSYDAILVKVDIENDLALLKVNLEDKELSSVRLAKYEPQKGDLVYSVGSPLGVERTISKGILSNFIEGFYVSDNTSTFGNSGGGLYNKDGELIGVPARVFVYVRMPPVPESGLGMSIELKIIKRFLYPLVK